MKRIAPLSIKKILLIVCLFSLCIANGQKLANKTLFGQPIRKGNVNPINGHIRCATTEYEKFLQGKNPKRMTNAQFEAWVKPLVNKQMAMRTTSQSGGIITIPVVVHVIYNGQAIGVAPNITDAQVESQITVLNQDYRKMSGTPGYNTNPVGADVQIEFALAKQDPNGNPTNGIDRVSLCQPSWSDIEMDSTVKPATIWDPTQYMNMWSVQFSDNTLLGYAQFPDASGLLGLNTSGGSANTDGVVSNYTVFGSNTYNDGTFLLDATYNKGRTMSHEVGHFLGLRHIWGDGTGDEASNLPDCTASDFCADTPQVGWEHYTCGTFDTCVSDPGNDMPENYMDYTNDACMNVFTQNQKDRMVVIMNNAARRSTLKTSTKNQPIALFADDAEVKLELSCDVGVCGALPNQAIQKITIYNRGTSYLTSAIINYNINGGSNIVYNWSGNLAINKSDTFQITINSASNGTINITSISSVNGGTDQRASNNTASGTFIIPTAASNYAFTNFVFRLQQDKWGSETTWDIKNSSGTVLYSGGPYIDKNSLPALITQNWILASNQCYTFTINDTAGDGICCGTSGDGYYDIKTNSGAIVVTSGSSFISTESKTFTTNTLGTGTFETSSDIYLYPNPTKGTLNIRIPSDFGLPNNFTINNMMGQIVSRKKVSTESDLTINTSTLSNGIYLITVEKDGAKKTMQFIKE